MRHLREILRRRLEAGLALKPNHKSQGVSLSVVQKITHKAITVGLDWASIEAVDTRGDSISVN